jgi:HK97 family phage major capsid protein
MSTAQKLHEQGQKLVADARAILDNSQSTEDQIQSAETMLDEGQKKFASAKKLVDAEKIDAALISGAEQIKGPGGQGAKDSEKAKFLDAWKDFAANGARMGADSKKILATQTTSPDSAGGYTVPEEFSTFLIQILEDMNHIRRLSTVRTTDATTNWAVETDVGDAEWTAEAAAYNESDITFNTKSMGAYKLTTLTKISEELLRDSNLNMVQVIAEAHGKRFARKEENVFINGDGVDKPTGLLTQAESGVTGAATTLTFDMIIDLYHSLREPYRSRASFIMNDNTIKALRKIKDSEGNYIWQPAVAFDRPDTLLGKELYSSIYMPTVAASAKSMMFGDFSYNWIGDRTGMVVKRLDELYAANGLVGFIASRRFDQLLSLPEAVKYLQHA